MYCLCKIALFPDVILFFEFSILLKYDAQYYIIKSDKYFPLSANYFLSLKSNRLLRIFVSLNMPLFKERQDNHRTLQSNNTYFVHSVVIFLAIASAT
jgi:hypothetical protein